MHTLRCMLLCNHREDIAKPGIAKTKGSCSFIYGLGVFDVRWGLVSVLLLLLLPTFMVPSSIHPYAFLTLEYVSAACLVAAMLHLLRLQQQDVTRPADCSCALQVKAVRLLPCAQPHMTFTRCAVDPFHMYVCLCLIIAKG